MAKANLLFKMLLIEKLLKQIVDDLGLKIDICSHIKECMKLYEYKR